jgi:hypothetical protein
MAKGRKRNDSAGENIKAFKHETETRKSVVPVGLASYDKLKPNPPKYDCDSHPPRSALVSSDKKKDSVGFILEHTASDGKSYKTQFYNLDAISSVGYRRSYQMAARENIRCVAC